MRTKPYDLIFMDMRMPSWTASPPPRKIRRLDGQAGTIPIIGLTANATPEDATRCLAAGMKRPSRKTGRSRYMVKTVARWCL